MDRRLRGDDIGVNRAECFLCAFAVSNMSSSMAFEMLIPAYRQIYC